MTEESAHKGRVWINSLFNIMVDPNEVPWEPYYRYYLTDKNGDSLFLDIAPSLWSGSPEYLQKYGYSLMNKYLDASNQYILYAMALSINAETHVKWFAERNKRDLALEFEKTMSKPKTWGYMGFEFLTNRDFRKPQIELAALKMLIEVIEQRRNT